MSTASSAYGPDRPSAVATVDNATPQGSTYHRGNSVQMNGAGSPALQKGLSKLAEALNHLNGLWSYATTEWLRLTLPSDDDKTRSRWPIHPLWGFLSSVDWEAKGGALTKRFSPTRSPNDDKLFQIGFSAILSYMAKHGFPAHELYEGSEEFMANAYAYHDQKAHELGLPFDDLIAEKLALKHRQFNTGLNDPELEEKRQARELEEQAKAYRNASGG